MNYQEKQLNSTGIFAKAKELKRLEQTQLELFLNINLVLKKEIEKYLKRQKKILVNGEDGIRKEVIDELVAMFAEFTKNIVLDQERVRKIKNKEKITARDLDDQLHQANLYNWWAAKQVGLYYKLKRLYYLQRAEEYEE